MTVTLILYGRVHQILRNQTEIPNWPPFANGDVPLLVKAPDDVQIGDFYNEETGEFTPGQDPKQDAIQEIEHQLAVIDAESGASGNVRDVSVSAGVVLGAVRVILAELCKDIKMPDGFGQGAVSAQEILALQPPKNATPEEIKKFELYRALMLLTRFDPAINQGLTELTKAEMAAAPLRQKLAELLQEQNPAGGE